MRAARYWMRLNRQFRPCKNASSRLRLLQMVIETGKPIASVAAQTGRASHARPICRIKAG